MTNPWFDSARYAADAPLRQAFLRELVVLFNKYGFVLSTDENELIIEPQGVVGYTYEKPFTDLLKAHNVTDAALHPR